MIYDRAVLLCKENVVRHRCIEIDHDDLGCVAPERLPQMIVVSFDVDAEKVEIPWNRSAVQDSFEGRLARGRYFGINRSHRGNVSVEGCKRRIRLRIAFDQKPPPAFIGNQRPAVAESQPVKSSDIHAVASLNAEPFEYLSENTV